MAAATSPSVLRLGHRPDHGYMLAVWRRVEVPSASSGTAIRRSVSGMTTRRFMAIAVAWLLVTLGISAGLMLAISPWLNHFNPYVVNLIWAVVGAGTLLLILLVPLWLYARGHA